MIVTDLEHATRQMALSPALRKALDFLQRVRGEELPDGKIEIDGDAAYADVQSYETRTNAGDPVFEEHRRYIDIHYLVSGEEIIGWARSGRLRETMPYAEGKDARLGTVPRPEVTPVRLSAGDLAVVYPTDAHAPRQAAGTPTRVKKIVIKVAVGG
ncbi:MAG: YhcH/YjgK/YiaL family protein [Anaerolineae bacterium]|nr:YhcH/YjgK/YiaL family protein [Anaerolineae bacterium]